MYKKIHEHGTGKDNVHVIHLWTDEGYENTDNYTELIRERNEELIHSMNTETKTFPEEILEGVR